MSARRVRIAGLLLVGILPALLLFVGVARFLLHHFFVRAPYLLDSGSNSAIVFHAGVFPDNPGIACDYAASYYDIHVSPFVSFFSLLSYLSPLGRIEWYVFVAALAFVPIALSTYALSSFADSTPSLRRLPIKILAALSFAFSGQVLWLIGYPHYEVAIPGLVCLTLVAVVAGWRRLAWLFLVFAASVREDAGLHTALALLPLFYLRWRGVDLRTSRRMLLQMIGVAIGASVFGFVIQSLFFHPANLLRVEYLGDPIYHHVSWSLVLDRTRAFIETRQVIYYPLLATILVSAICRDAGYLLGWVATLPWFFVNLLAYQPEKGAFALYTGFPFVVSLFWVYLYGVALVPAHRRLRPNLLDAILALVCASSTLGFARAAPVVLSYTVKEMVYAPRMNRAAVHGFVDALTSHRVELGRLYVDSAVAALALESLRLEDVWHPGAKAVDTLAFHRDTWAQADTLLPDLITNHLSICTHVIDTGIFVCSREALPAAIFAGLSTETVPSILLFARPHRSGADELTPLGTRLAVRGLLGRLPAGTYELRLSFETSAPGDSVVLEIQAGVNSKVVRAASGSRQVVATKFASDGKETLSFRLSSASTAPIIVTGGEALPASYDGADAHPTTSTIDIETRRPNTPHGL